MFISILLGTPMWVWIVLAGLIYLGWKQSHDREVSKRRAFLIPLVMMAFSFHGVTSSFGGSINSLLFWGLGLICSILIFVIIFPVQNARFDPQTQRFYIKGSWIPLCTIFAIFFVKYSVGVMEGMQVSELHESIVISSLSLLYGVFSGFFAARSLGLLKISQQSENTI